MTASRSDDPDHPRILSLAGGRRTVRQLCASVVDEVTGARTRRGAVPVTVACDVVDAPLGDAEADVWRDLLTCLVEAACAASADYAPPRGVPHVREVLVTGVDAADGLELEVADSGPGLGAAVATPAALRVLATARPFAERLGGGVECRDCPVGGLAVTVRVPRRRAQRRAA